MATTTRLQQAKALRQGIWHDGVSRDFISSGRLERLVSLGLTGLTSNPTIFEKGVADGADYDRVLLDEALMEHGPRDTYETLAAADIRAAADLLRPVYDRSAGEDGYACLEVSAAPASDTGAMLEEARRLHAALERPNVMIKIPATSGGIPAVRQLISEGINVNITLIFSPATHQKVMEAYIGGLEDLVRDGGDPSRIASVASLFLSRIDTLVDSQLETRIHEGREELRRLLGQAALATAKVTYQNFKTSLLASPRFAPLAARGARVQRPLWASTGTKNPAYGDLHYVEPLIGADTVDTMPPDTLDAFLEHGRVEPTLERGVTEARKTLEALGAAGIEMGRVAEQLRDDGFELFADSYKKLLAHISEKQPQLLARKAQLTEEVGI